MDTDPRASSQKKSQKSRKVDGAKDKSEGAQTKCSAKPAGASTSAKAKAKKVRRQGFFSSLSPLTLPSCPSQSKADVVTRDPVGEKLKHAAMRSGMLCSTVPAETVASKPSKGSFRILFLAEAHFLVLVRQKSRRSTASIWSKSRVGAQSTSSCSQVASTNCVQVCFLTLSASSRRNFQSAFKLLAGRIGDITQMDTQNPVAYIDWAGEGRLKLQGTIVHPKAKMLLLKKEKVKGNDSVVWCDTPPPHHSPTF